MAWTSRDTVVYLTHPLVPSDTPLGATVYLDVDPTTVREAAAIAEELDTTLTAVLSAVARHIRFFMQPSPGYPGFPGPCRLLPRGMSPPDLHLTRFVFCGTRLVVTFTVRVVVVPCGTHYFRIEVQGVER